MRKLIATLVMVLTLLGAGPVFAGITGSKIDPNAAIEAYKLKFSYATQAAYVAARLAEYSARGITQPSLAAGDCFYNTTSKVWNCYNGSAWATAGATLQSAYDGGDTIVISAANGTIEIEDATASAVDSMSVSRTAGSGDLLYLTNSSGTAGNDIVGDAWSMDNAGSLVCVDATLAAVTGTAAGDLDVVSAAGQDIDVTLGDAAGANYFDILALGGASVASVDSLGGVIATGITLPVVTSTAGGDLSIFAAAGFDIDVILGDLAGANYFTFQDPGGGVVASIDSLGDFVCNDINPVGSISLDTGESLTSAAELTLSAAAGSDINITNLAGAGDTIVKLGDAAGAQSFSVVDSADEVQFKVFSDSLFEFGVMATQGLSMDMAAAAPENLISHAVTFPVEWITIPAGAFTSGDAATVEGRVAGAAWGGFVMLDDGTNDDFIETYWQPPKWGTGGGTGGVDVSAQIVVASAGTSCVLHTEICYLQIVPGTTAVGAAPTCVSALTTLGANTLEVTRSAAATLPHASFALDTRKPVLIQVWHDENGAGETCTSADFQVMGVELEVTRLYMD